MVSENEFYLVNKNPYRGSRYASFVGAGIDPQGNVSYATNENDENQLGTSVDTSQVQTPGTALETGKVSQGLVSGPGDDESQQFEVPSFGKAAKDLVIGAALPYAGKQIGQAAGIAIGGGATTGQALNAGVQQLTSKVSGGLIGGTVGLGAGRAATNSALSSLGSKFGPATAAQVSKAAGSSAGSVGALGGAAGAGIGTFAATLLTGGDVKEAAKAGAGAAIGTAIGTAVGGPIGGFIGGTIGSIFCFVLDTPILMEDGTTKVVQDIKLGDRVMAGGEVMGRGEGWAETLYRYKNTIVSGSHAVFEDGVWLRVFDSELGEEIEDFEEQVVYPLVTENNLVMTPWFIAADILEVVEGDDVAFSSNEKIAILNADKERNKKLTELEREVCIAEQLRNQREGYEGRGCPAQ